MSFDGSIGSFSSLGSGFGGCGVLPCFALGGLGGYMLGKRGPRQQNRNVNYGPDQPIYYQSPVDYYPGSPNQYPYQAQPYQYPYPYPQTPPQYYPNPAGPWPQGQPTGPMPPMPYPQDPYAQAYGQTAQAYGQPAYAQPQYQQYTPPQSPSTYQYQQNYVPSQPPQYENSHQTDLADQPPIPQQPKRKKRNLNCFCCGTTDD